MFSLRKLFRQGGPGSGFKDHAGRPGKVGGSVREHPTDRKVDVTRPFNVTPGMTLYHTSPKSFDRLKDRPTWFTPSKEQAAGYNSNTNRQYGTSSTYEYTFVKGNIASEEDAIKTAREVWPDEEGIIHSMFDENIGEYEKKDVRLFISKLQAKGYNGVVHADYNAINDQDDAYTLVLFNPNRSSKRKGEVAEYDLYS